MTDDEKRQLVEAVITQLKEQGTDVSDARIETDTNGIGYVVAYDKLGNIVRAVPTAISSEKQGTHAYMNAYTEAGVYNINTMGGEDLPIDNQGAISARLTVLVTESDGNNVITQVLNLNNNAGGEGNVYIRSCQNGEWKAWGKLQTNIEVVELVEKEKSRAEQAEEEISQNAIAADSMGYSTTTTDMSLEFETLNGESHGSVTFPSATTEQAGVMSAADKEKLDNLSQGGGGSGDITALRSLFVAAGAEYNDTNANKTKTAPWGETVQHLPKHYYLNGLGDITEEQMIEIYNAGRVMQNVAGFYNSNRKIRTNLPSLHSTASGYSRTFEGRGMFLACTMLEVAILSVNKTLDNKITATSTDAQYVFLNCPKVRYISRLNLDGGTSAIDMFRFCSSLSHVEIKQLSTNLSFSDSPLIDKESILYLIQGNKAKSAITVTLHADAYARLANDADIVAALAAQPLVTLVSA